MFKLCFKRGWQNQNGDGHENVMLGWPLENLCRIEGSAIQETLSINFVSRGDFSNSLSEICERYNGQGSLRLGLRSLYSRTESLLPIASNTQRLIGSDVPRAGNV